MAVDKLALYNGALLILGQRKLASLTEDRPPRYYLDQLWDEGAVAYCLELAQPLFARVSVELTGGATPTVPGYDKEYTLPADLRSIVGVFHDDKMREPVHRYLLQGGKLLADTSDDKVYLRYVSTSYETPSSSWSPSFTKMVQAYLAQQLSIKFAPDLSAGLNSAFVEATKVVTELNRRDEPAPNRGAATTLTPDWLRIYNDALLILGKDEITDVDADSPIRWKLDAAVNARLVETLLEDTSWLFALTSLKSTYDPSIEPAWGYRRAHALPNNMQRLDGVFQDEYFQVPLKHYVQENGVLYTDLDDIYLQYVSKDWLSNPALWPASFSRLVAARIARDVAPAVGGDANRATQEYKDREMQAKSNDAVASPPRLLSNGSWVTVRFNSGNYRGRP